jgi:hypothetical protein
VWKKAINRVTKRAAVCYFYNGSCRLNQIFSSIQVCGKMAIACFDNPSHANAILKASLAESDTQP